MDMNIMCYKTADELGDLPLIKTYPLTSDNKLGVSMMYFAPIGPSPCGGAYNFDEPNFVYRWNTFLYYPRSALNSTNNVRPHALTERSLATLCISTDRFVGLHPVEA